MDLPPGRELDNTREKSPASAKGGAFENPDPVAHTEGERDSSMQARRDDALMHELIRDLFNN